MHVPVFPQLATLGGLLLALIMLGAVATHLVHGETARVLVPLVLSAVLTAIAWARRKADRTRPNLV
jgi:DoxX-like family